MLRRPGGPQRRLIIAAACFAVAASVYAVWRGSSSTHEEMRAAARHTRVIEARLSGFPWAPQTVTRGGRTAETLRLASSAAAVVADDDERRDPEVLRDRAVAEMVLERPAQAVETIEEAVRLAPSDALLWSDAAAIFLAAAKRLDRPHELPRALVAADRALRLDPRLAEGRFNRALILEAIGVERQADAAWQHYLASDPSSDWAREAREHLPATAPETRVELFSERLPVLMDAAQKNDAATVRQIVAAFPQQARASAEVEILGQWADAVRHGDEDAARRTLTTARAVASVLREEQREELLTDAIRAVDAANGAERTRLAEASALYRRGRRLHAQKRPEDAEPLLRQAETLFARSGSPMSLVARYYVGSALYAMHRVPEAYALLTALRDRVPPDRYQALDAQIHWELGLCSAVSGDWGPATASYEHAAAVFQRLGETANLAFIRNLLAESADYLGDRETAWRHRRELFPILSREGTGNRLQVSIGTAARAELRARRYDTAVSLLQLEIAEARSAPASEGKVLAFAARARSLRELGERAGAEEDLRAARAAVAELQDAALRQSATAAVDVAEASVMRDTAPRHALALLSRAQESYERAGRRLALPYIALERGRAFRRLHADDDALSAYLAGIAELEQQRDSIGDYERRVGVFDAGQPLFLEAADLLLQARRDTTALELVDRSRGRSTVDAVLRRAGHGTRLTVADVQTALPARSVLIEYLVLPQRLALFVLTKDGLETHVADVAEGDVREAAMTLAAAVRQGASRSNVNEASDAASRLLLAPASAAIRQADTVIFVPDRFLQLVPFAALRHDASFLIEQAAVVVSPSASLLPATGVSRRAAPRVDALVFGNPSTSGRMDDLRASETEARTVAAAYPRAHLATGSEATRERFLREYGHAAIVHFAGHATIDPARGNAAALAFAGNSAPALVGAHEIARTTAEATRLVVLAACETFAGTRMHFEGTPTLAHAFLAAGVPTVAGTLWPVDDTAARELFTRFHAEVRTGARPAAALRTAQLALLHSANENLRHPTHWAAVEVLGSDPAH